MTEELLERINTLLYAIERDGHSFCVEDLAKEHCEVCCAATQLNALVDPESVT